MCDNLEATLVSHWALGGPFGVTLGHFGLTLGPSWVTFGPFGLPLELLWSHLGHMRVTLGGTLASLWGYFGVTLKLLWVYKGDV